MMIEKIIYDYLNTLDYLLTPVYTEIPKSFPGPMYLIEKTGDSRTDRINTATIVIQSYANTLYDAMVLNDVIKAIMLDGLIALDEISGIKLNSDYNYTDTQTKRYRYQAVFLVTYYD